MDYCILEFMVFEGFGSRGRTAFLNVVATRLTQQYVLGTMEKNARTDVPHVLGAAQQTFKPFVREI